MTARDDATAAQVRAADPGRSTWLSANAGSGKTRVLTDRVARLLLRGVNPQHILCLTYTKAAATEMQNRLFARLGEWAMLEDGALGDALDTLGAAGPRDAAGLRHARRLFARAIEAPGGLRIQTIHAFCAALLRRFPREAGISPHFAEMEERDAADLRAGVLSDIADGPQAPVLQTLLHHVATEDPSELTAAICKARAAFRLRPDDATLARTLGQAPGLSAETLCAQVFTGGEAGLLARLVTAMRAGSVTDRKNAERLAGLSLPDPDALPVLERVFLTGKSAKTPFSAKTGSVPTKAVRASLGDLMPEIDAFMIRIEAAREPRLALDALLAARALHDFAAVFLPAYAHAKERRGWLDFDDLILRSRALLTDPLVAQWVLYRLDGGLDHILVDEAQDTSPEQWQVIERLAQEFTSGEGARSPQERTIFVVGDRKQSIYSFQGADPREFDRMRDDFAARLHDSGAPLRALDLAWSFRSSPAILQLVDATFSGQNDSSFPPGQSHIAFKAALPGRCDLWPAVESPDKPEEADWHLPVDLLAPDDPALTLAHRIADEVARLIAQRQPLPCPKAPGGFRALQPGDILILVQRRSALFHELIRACKTRGLPVAGADRLRIGAELAVRDLAALLAFLDTPADSLSLATALRSPLFHWSESALFELAHGRGPRDLWPALTAARARHPTTVAVIEDLLATVDFLRPYELLERILTRHGGRHALLSRLGAEAEDGIDALLAQAMVYERRAVDSLTGFLGWLRTDDLEIKRQLDSAGNRIRVMTVHGAKGLEAPMVILPDTGDRPLRHRKPLLDISGVPFPKPSADDLPEVLSDAIDSDKAADRAERDRLLYVAMTRAEAWLIVARHGTPSENGDSWHDMVRAGMDRAGAGPLDTPAGAGLRLQFDDWPERLPQASADPETPTQAEDLPSWSAPRPAPARAAAPAALSPSDLGGAKALPGKDGLSEDEATTRGRQIHLLLEHLAPLPPAARSELATALLANGPDPAPQSLQAELLAEASVVLDAPHLARLFSGDALAEVELSAPLPTLGGRRVHGVVDRLILSPGHVLAVDFKSNAVLPEHPEAVPEGLLRQMGAYAEALAQIYPDARIETAILWTRAPCLMRLPHDLVLAALARATPA